MLAAQGLRERLAIVTADDRTGRYGVDVVGA
jgi:hypothetical protein